METKEEMVRVKSANEIMIPSVMPKDFALLPPTADEDKTIGSSGQMQGAKIVTSPEMKAKRRRRIIILSLFPSKTSPYPTDRQNAQLLFRFLK